MAEGLSSFRLGTSAGKNPMSIIREKPSRPRHWRAFAPWQNMPQDPNTALPAPEGHWNLAGRQAKRSHRLGVRVIGVPEGRRKCRFYQRCSGL